MPSGINLLMTPAASQANDENAMAALWGSQSWLQPAFSRPFAGHEGSLTQEPPERRPRGDPRARLPAPRLFSEEGSPCASERNSDQPPALRGEMSRGASSFEPSGR